MLVLDKTAVGPSLQGNRSVQPAGSCKEEGTLLLRGAPSPLDSEGGSYGWKPSPSSNFSIRGFRAYYLTEIRQTVPCRAIRGDSISVNGTLPPRIDGVQCLSGCGLPRHEHASLRHRRRINPPPHVCAACGEESCTAFTICSTTYVSEIQEIHQ